MTTASVKDGNRHLVAARLQEAVRCFEEATASEPGNPAAWRGLATALERLGDFEKIVNRLGLVVDSVQSSSVRKKLADAERVLALRGRREFADAAISNYRLALADAPDPVSYYYLGVLLADVKAEFLEAAAAYKASLELDPSSPSVRNALQRAERHEQEAIE